MLPPTHLLDTNICVYLLAGITHVVERVATFAPGRLATSAIVAAELARGNREEGPIDGQGFERFREQIPILPFDLNAAFAFARLPLKRDRLDRLIAAHALALGATLVTNNQRDFADVPALHTEDWTRA